jgi:hypothetical protein
MTPELRGVRRWAGASFLALALTVTAVGRAAAEDPLTIALGAAGESGTVIVAPTVYIRAPLNDRHLLWASQIGWTSSLGYQALLSRHATFLAELRGTPWRANLADVAFQDGGLTEEGTFEAAQLLGDVGIRFSGESEHRAELAFAIFHPFVEGLEAATLDRWNTFHIGARIHLRAAWLRSDDPLRGRSDGLSLRADVRGFLGSSPWVDARLAVQAGRRWGRLFLSGSLSGFYITSADAFSRLPVGGSWDALGADAVYGFPLGAYRLASGGVASLRSDFLLFGPLELGLRGSALVYPDGVSYGGSVQLMLRVGGFDIHAGVGLGRPEKFAPNAFGSLRALWMF